VARDRAGIACMLICAFIENLGIGVAIPAVPALISQISGEGLEASAAWSGWLLLIFALGQFLASPLIGALSDRFGRRPVLIVSTLAIGADFLISGTATSVLGLVVARALAGLLSATSAAAAAYVGDISNPETRARHFGQLSGAFMLGIIIGPILGGIAGANDPRLTFLVAAALAIAGGLLGLLFLPESLPAASRTAMRISQVNPFRPLNDLGALHGLRQMFAALLLVNIALDALPVIWTFYVMRRFGWSMSEAGYSISYMAFSAAIVTFWYTGALTRRLGAARTLTAGLLLTALSSFGYAWAPNRASLYVALSLGAVGAVAMPAFQTMLTGAAQPNSLGRLQGAIASTRSIASVVGPVLFTQCFEYYASPGATFNLPGAPFALAGLCALGAIPLAQAGLAKRRHAPPA
jgi:MFS transporter, DHA1 family, tetracycline resistance protein